MGKVNEEKIIKIKVLETIVIERETLPGLNKVLRMHWGKREALVTFWKELVGWECKRRKLKLIDIPVAIFVTCYFETKSKMLDADNICDKLAIDGLKGIVIAEDNPAYVTGALTSSRLDRDNPRTEIMIGDIYDEKME